MFDWEEIYLTAVGVTLTTFGTMFALITGAGLGIVVVKGLFWAFGIKGGDHV